MLCSSAGLPLICQLASAASVPFLPAGIEREPHVERMPDKYQNCHIRWRMPASPMSSDRTGTSVAMTPLSRAGLPSEGADMPCNSAELLWTRQSSQLLLSLPSSLRRWIATLMRGGALSSAETGTLGTPASKSSAEVPFYGADLHSSPLLRPDTPSYTGTSIIGLPALQEA